MANTIANLTESRYGVNALTCDPHVVIWAADRVLKASGAKGSDVAQELRAINTKRIRMGRIGAFPSYGTALWGFYFPAKVAR